MPAEEEEAIIRDLTGRLLRHRSVFHTTSMPMTDAVLAGREVEIQSLRFGNGMPHQLGDVEDGTVWIDHESNAVYILEAGSWTEVGLQNSFTFTPQEHTEELRGDDGVMAVFSETLELTMRRNRPVSRSRTLGGPVASGILSPAPDEADVVFSPQVAARRELEANFAAQGQLRIIVTVYDFERNQDEVLSGPYETAEEAHSDAASLEGFRFDHHTRVRRLLIHEARSECNHCWQPSGFKHQLHCQYSANPSR